MERRDLFEEEEEPTITIKEYIEGVEAQELEADMVLGGDEGKECTYSQGYVKRQAVFSCLSCTPAGNAGVCTACCLTCHDGHQVVELWTRRQFRCDCGNSKFKGIHCKLLGEKDSENTYNAYNQNYKGLYCTCHRPYPDPDEEDLGEMIQCCICEDWFHEKHLGLEPIEQIPRDDEGDPIYDDFVCKDCAFHISFMLNYSEIIIMPSIVGRTTTSNELQKQFMEVKKNEKDNSKNGASEMIVKQNEIVVPALTSVLSSDDDQLEQPCTFISDAQNNGQLLQPSCAGHNVEKGIAESSSVECGNCLKESNAGGNHSNANEDVVCSISKAGYQSLNDQTGLGKATSITYSSLLLDQTNKGTNVQEQESACKLRTDMNEPLILSEKRKPLFLGKNWRDFLCKCSSCQDLYTKKGVTFLLDQGDTLEEYEKVAKQKREEKLQHLEGVEMNFLQTLGHVQQIELLSGFSEMKNDLLSYLESFDSGKVVTCEDIHEFFQNLRRKRQRLA